MSCFFQLHVNYSGSLKKAHQRPMQGLEWRARSASSFQKVNTLRCKVYTGNFKKVLCIKLLRNPSPDLPYLALPLIWALGLALTCFSSLSLSLSALSLSALSLKSAIYSGSYTTVHISAWVNGWLERECRERECRERERGEAS